jgi:hypothetical protein
MQRHSALFPSHSSGSEQKLGLPFKEHQLAAE